MSQGARDENQSLESYRDYLMMVARGKIGVSYRGKIDAEAEKVQEGHGVAAAGEGHQDPLSRRDELGGAQVLLQPTGEERRRTTSCRCPCRWRVPRALGHVSFGRALDEGEGRYAPCAVSSPGGRGRPTR